MSNKTAIVTIGLLLIAGTLFDGIFSYIAFLVKLSVIIFFLANGKLIRTVFFYIILVLAGIVFIEIIRTLFWQSSNVIILIGFLAIPVVYTIYFLIYKAWKLLDILKWLWVVLQFLATAMIISHWSFGHELLLTANIVFIAMFVTYGFTFLKKEKQIEMSGD